MELWFKYTAGALNRLRCCYIKCIKSFFKYSKYYSVTNMFFELNLPTFDTLLNNSKYMLHSQMINSGNGIVSHLNQIVLHA